MTFSGPSCIIWPIRRISIMTVIGISPQKSRPVLLPAAGPVDAAASRARVDPARAAR